jgi:hypothetical protein
VLKTADILVSSVNTNAEQLMEKVKLLESVLERGDRVVADIVEGLQRSGLAKDHQSDGNNSLYLVFVGVVFLSILDCF